MLLYSVNAAGRVMIWARTWERSAGSPATSLTSAAIAPFSPADALLIVSLEFSAAPIVTAAALVLDSAYSSAARLAPVGRERYTSARGRSWSTAARKSPVGRPVALRSVSVRDRLMVARAVRLVAKMYSPMRDSTGTRTRRRIFWRIDRRCKPIALAPRCGRNTEL